MSKAVVCWESNIVTARRGCDSVDAISTMWTHTGYASHLVTRQRFVHSTCDATRERSLKFFFKNILD